MNTCNDKLSETVYFMHLKLVKDQNKEFLTSACFLYSIV